uniref:Sulfotransferase n=1 Tax=Cyanoderma ruficeps TaxID=181631 RepID=A0A8C3NWR2_9PASS
MIAAASSMHRDELLFSYKGIPYPITVCSPEVFKALESFEARSDDVILCPFSSFQFFKRMTKLPSPRFMVTHLLPENLPKSIFKNQVKILLLIRNPKDVAVSFYHFSNGVATLPSYDTWDDFFTDFMTKKICVCSCIPVCDITG